MAGHGAQLLTRVWKDVDLIPQIQELISNSNTGCECISGTTISQEFIWGLE